MEALPDLEKATVHCVRHDLTQSREQTSDAAFSRVDGDKWHDPFAAGGQSGAGMAEMVLLLSLCVMMGIALGEILWPYVLQHMAVWSQLSLIDTPLP